MGLEKWWMKKEVRDLRSDDPEVVNRTYDQVIKVIDKYTK
jgi:hypothetical protein